MRATEEAGSAKRRKQTSMADDKAKDDLSGDWWLSHVGEMADHYRNVYQRHELRARYVLIVVGFVIAGARILYNDSNLATWSVNSIFLFFWLFFLIISSMLLITVMVPLTGSRFFEGSFEDILFRLLRHLQWRALQKLAPYQLSDEFREASLVAGERGEPARQCLARYLNTEFRTDLMPWLTGNPPGMVDDQTYDIRRRQIFWYWANKEASNRKAVLLEVAIGLILWSSALSFTSWVAVKAFVVIRGLWAISF